LRNAIDNPKLVPSRGLCTIASRTTAHPELFKMGEKNAKQSFEVWTRLRINQM
jgi:hypothetical protein